MRLQPSYDLAPINSLAAASRAIGADRGGLERITSKIPRQYRRIELDKSDKGKRICWDPSQQLRHYQKNLVRQILKRTHYPHYLHGGLPTRDYVSNAEAHVNARWGFCADIASFFPSISDEQVFDIWRSLFGFSPNVSSIFTQLTTLNGYLPQGSLTASYLANLVFWRTEHKTVRQLNRRGFTYTRFIDDVTLTTQRHQAKNKLTESVRDIQILLHKNGFRSKRGPKERVLNSKVAKTALGLDLTKKVGRSRAQRNRLAKEIISAAGIVAGMPASDAEKHLNSLRGRVNELRRFHVREASRLSEVLDRALIETLS